MRNLTEDIVHALRFVTEPRVRKDGSSYPVRAGIVIEGGRVAGYAMAHSRAALNLELGWRATQYLDREYDSRPDVIARRKAAFRAALARRKEV